MTISSTEKTASALARRPAYVVLCSRVTQLWHVLVYPGAVPWERMNYSVMMLVGTATETVHSRGAVGLNRVMGPFDVSV